MRHIRKGGACSYCGAVEGEQRGVMVNDGLCVYVLGCFQRAGKDARSNLLEIEELARARGSLTGDEIEAERRKDEPSNHVG